MHVSRLLHLVLLGATRLKFAGATPIPHRDAASSALDETSTDTPPANATQTLDGQTTQTGHRHTATSTNADDPSMGVSSTIALDPGSSSRTRTAHGHTTTSTETDDPSSPSSLPPLGPAGPVSTTRGHHHPIPSSTDTDDPPSGPSPTTGLDPGPTSAPTNGTQNSTSTGAPHFVVYAIDTADDAPGPPPVDKLTGFNVVALAFLLTDGKPADSSQAEQWQQLDASKRAEVKAAYKEAGIKLLVSFGGETEKPTTSGADPKDTATTVAQWVKDYDLDGIDVDYEDFDAMSKGTGEQWVIDFTTQLHTELGIDYLISHAPIAGWFSAPRSDLPGGGYRTIHKSVGDMIDWYNIQFYNSPGEDTTCDNLLMKSNSSYLAGSSVFEINSQAQVPLEKIVIGKPATEKDAESGYMKAPYLATCAQQAAQKKWTGGIMFWKYTDAASGIMQAARKLAFPVSDSGNATTIPVSSNSTTPATPPDNSTTPVYPPTLPVPDNSTVPVDNPTVHVDNSTVPVDNSTVLPDNSDTPVNGTETRSMKRRRRTNRQ
ncbi:glycoside hydrolase superfamily [Mycena polygramma]|nr:glycoside hydrolase superfamily [Mycena polygramma]